MLTSPAPQSLRLGSILAIDDEPEVGHGGDGLMLADVERPDVVVLDIMMPGIDGVDVLKQLRVRWPELPGAFDYVQKPSPGSISSAW